MRAIIQRVSSASVTVDGEVISQISKGLMVLVGIGSDDTTKDVEYIAKKILTMRVFDDNDGTMWKAGVKDISGEVLSVSQFTLMANTTKGNKPDFHGAMGGSSSNGSSASSREMYSTFLNRLGELYEPSKIKDGQFGAMMSVSLVNEGPVTLQIDSRKFEYVPVDDSKPSKKAKSGTSTPATPGESAQGTA